MNYTKLKDQLGCFIIFGIKLLYLVNTHFNNIVINLYSIKNSIFYYCLDLTEFNKLLILKLY
ncbi:hypothetical protein IHI24_000915 [Rickettsia endosymbiont of Cardiosporidium cionae]|nr:hypothetical protein IHI24_000915 [Rickettsia endosymbiont of Cardiosporidium cionae]